MGYFLISAFCSGVRPFPPPCASGAVGFALFLRELHRASTSKISSRNFLLIFAPRPRCSRACFSISSAFARSSGV